jgi:putative transposase
MKARRKTSSTGSTTTDSSSIDTPSKPKYIQRSYKFRLYPTPKQVEELERVLEICRWVYNSCLQEWREAYEVWRWSTPIDEFLVAHQEWYRQQKADDAAWWEKNGHGDQPKLPEKPKINEYSQVKALTELKELLPELKTAPAHTLNEVVSRVELARQKFYDRAKTGQKGGYPHFKGKGRYDSFTYPDAHQDNLIDGASRGVGWHYERKRDARFGKLTLSMGAGQPKLFIKIRVHRRSDGIFGQVRTLTILGRQGLGMLALQ